MPQDHLAPLFQDVETGCQHRSRSFALLDVPETVRLGGQSAAAVAGEKRVTGGTIAKQSMGWAGGRCPLGWAGEIESFERPVGNA